jgi:type IV pilus assembly protein PilM
LAQTKNGLQLTKYFQREILNDPSVDDETKRKQRTEAIRAILKEARVRNRKTVLCVPGRSVFTRTRTLPPVPQYKVAQIVRYEIQQQIPFALDQIALDYQILNRTEAGSYDVMMVAIKVDVVDKQLEVLKDTKCRIRSVDVSPIAAYNWLKHAGEFGTEGECVALLDLGSSTTDIVIERGNQFRFTRPLNIGGDDITRAISKDFGLNFGDAEKAKRQRAFAPTGDPKVDGKLGEVIGPVLNRLINEVSRSFGYFRSLPGGGTVDRVVVTGGGAKLKNMIPFLQRHLGLDVRIARPLAGLSIGPHAQAANEFADHAAVALGMALRCVQPATIEINLIPPQVTEAARRKEQALYWVLSLIAMGLIAASVIPTRQNQDRQVLEDIKKLESVLEQYDPELAKDPTLPVSYQEKELDDKKAEVDRLMRHLKTLGMAYQSAPNWLDDLKLINDLRPEGGKIWFSSIETSIVTPASQQPSGASGERRGALGGAGMRGQVSTGVNSTGFTGLNPASSMAQAGPQPRRNKDEGGGIGSRLGTTSATEDPSKVPGPPAPNGYKIMGYAKDPDSLTLFINRLKETKRFSPPGGGVFWSEATIEQVHISELDNARIVQQHAAAAPSASSSSSDREGRGGALRIASGGGGSSTSRGAGSAPVGGFLPGESVYFFRVDVQFAPPPAPVAGTGGARSGVPRAITKGLTKGGDEEGGGGVSGLAAKLNAKGAGKAADKGAE